MSLYNIEVLEVDENKRKKISIDLLLKKQIVDIGRTGNVLWLKFANPKIDNTAEQIEADHIFTLHIFCDCRMIDQEKREIVFGSSDLYDNKAGTEWSEDFDWNVQGANQYDEQVKKWLAANNGVYVEKIKFNVLRDLRLLLSNGHVFEIIVTFTSEGECWRFFEEDSKRDHFVVTGKGLIIEYEAE
ncbi:hypothetical protein JW979_15600 [bacterium]|nr:hypothetical protein [candidate division CSSED10-310 bacterium]